MSHPITMNCQVEAYHPAVKVDAFAVEPVLPLAGGNLSRETQFRIQIQDQRQVGPESLRGRKIRCPHQRWIESPTRHLVGFGRESIAVGEDYPPSLESRTNGRLDQIGPGCQIEEKFCQRADRMLWIEQGLSRDLGSSG